MNRRFFVETAIRGGRASLRGAEVQHLSKVLRARVGDEVVLFDGSGSEFRSRVLHIHRDQVELEVLTAEIRDRELSVPLILGVALPKGERQRWLVEKAVELGVTRLVPLQTARGVAEPGERAAERLRRAVVEASKQCGRNRLMEIAAPLTLAGLLAAAPAEALQLIADPGPAALPLAPLLARDRWPSVWIAVGPEGGFSDAELAAAGPNAHRISLGKSILRVETAALAAAAAVALAQNT